jgi:D-alanine transaminase
MIKVNKLDQGFVYLQITRGVKEREHHYSDVKLKPTIILTAKKIDLNKIKKTQSLGVKVTIFDDLRWKRCDIKSISLLPNVMAKNYAYKKSFYESLLVDESGNISEGSSTNAWMVNKNNVVITRKANNQILNGITRQVVMSVLKRNKFKVMEKSFSVKDAKKSKEFFITGTTTFVMPVVKIDKVTIGNGKPGTVTKQISKFFMERLK